MVVNSEFTASVFRKTFRGLDVKLSILYPAVDIKDLSANTSLGGAAEGVVADVEGLPVNTYVLRGGGVGK